MATALRLRDMMTVEDFLDWDDGTDTRFELERGVPVAMAPPMPAHATIAQNVGEIINERVRGRPPCRAMQGAGVLISREKGRFYIPDVLMTCEPPSRERYVAEPRLIVEVLSPTTGGVDKWEKAPEYGKLPSVQELWLVESQSRHVLVWRRTGESWLANFPYKGSEGFDSPALGGEVGLDRIYHLTGVEDAPAA